MNNSLMNFESMYLFYDDTEVYKTIPQEIRILAYIILKKDFDEVNFDNFKKSELLIAHSINHYNNLERENVNQISEHYKDCISIYKRALFVCKRSYLTNNKFIDAEIFRFFYDKNLYIYTLEKNEFITESELYTITFNNLDSTLKGIKENEMEYRSLINEYLDGYSSLYNFIIRTAIEKREDKENEKINAFEIPAYLFFEDVDLLTKDFIASFINGLSGAIETEDVGKGS